MRNITVKATTHFISSSVDIGIEELHFFFLYGRTLVKYTFFLFLFSLWLLHFFMNDVWQGQFSSSGSHGLCVFPYQCQVSLVVVTQEYFNDYNIWKTSSCSVTLLFMELCNNSGWMGPLESVWPKPCSLAACMCRKGWQDSWSSLDDVELPAFWSSVISI